MEEGSLMDSNLEDKLAEQGVTVMCESPLELETEDGDSATGIFAAHFIECVKAGEVDWL